MAVTARCAAALQRACWCCLQLFDDLVVLRAVHEVVDRDVLGAGRLVPGPRRQVLVGDDQVDVVGQVGDRHVDHRDVGETGLLDLVPQHRGAHRAGPHAGVAGEDDLVDRRRARTSASCASSAASASASMPVSTPDTELFLPFICLHLRGRRGQVALSSVLLAGLQDHRGDDERGHRGRAGPTASPRRNCRRVSGCSTAMIDPGAAGARRPASKIVRVRMPTMPPAMVATSRIGFISTYGK